MFNSSLKKECIKELESCIKIYDGVIENTKTSSIKLLDIRMKAVKLIGIVERYINTIANTPKSFETEFSEIRLIVNNFNKELSDIEYESKKTEKMAGGMAGVGIAAGAGVAAFAPTAAMAIATTAGTTRPMPSPSWPRRVMTQVSGLAPSQMEEMAAAPPMSKFTFAAAEVMSGARSVAM